MRVSKNIFLNLAISLVSVFGEIAFCQDLPLYSQKLTNSFLYNPSVAGNGMGSATFANKRFWNGVPGAPFSNFVSIHTPIAMQKIGVGFNFMNEKVSALTNTYMSGAFAYHLKFTDETILSMGVSSEYTSLRFDPSKFDARDEGDPLINVNPVSSLDFSFGMSFKTKYFDAGLSSNRLATALALGNISSQISEFYTGYINGNIELAKNHRLEPTFVYRRLSPESSQWDAGAYYTFNNAITLGASYRQEGLMTATTALKFNNKFLIGYSFELFGTGIQRSIGGTNEITLRIDFRDDSYVRNTDNSRAVMSQSMAYRRKTLSSSGVNKKRPVSPSSAKFKKKLKRNYMKSPSYRLNNSTKLNTSKVSKNNVRKTIKKRGSSRGGKYNNTKKRKQNAKKYSNKKRKKKRRR